MKVVELFETVSDVPASKADLDVSVEKIKEVKKALDDLAKQDKYDPSKQTNAKARRQAEATQHMLAEAQWRMDFAIKLHEKIIPVFNKIKAAVNTAITGRDEDSLKKLHRDLKDLVITHDLIKNAKRVMHRDLTRYKVEKDYPRKIYDTIQWILEIRDRMPKAILVASRSDVENERAAKSSAAMKARWGSIE